MKLRYTKRSPYARKCRIVAMEKGVEINWIEENLQDKSSDLLRENPLGKIPILSTEDGKVLTDSSLICEFLDALNPAPVLWPEDKALRLKLKNIDVLAKGLMDVTVSLFYEKLIHPDDFNQAFIERQEETISRCLSYFDENKEMLEPFTMASISVVCAIGYIQFRTGHIWEQASLERLKAWYHQMLKRVSISGTIPVLN